jgi:hypothetical protein
MNRSILDNEARLKALGKGIKKNVLIGRGVIDKSGTPLKLKDACYHKVKKQYDVFPSAYASGAIAKCRKNKGKK